MTRSIVPLAVLLALAAAGTLAWQASGTGSSDARRANAPESLPEAGPVDPRPQGPCVESTDVPTGERVKRGLQGQVRGPDDQLATEAVVRLRNLTSREVTQISCDQEGRFAAGLESGAYVAWGEADGWAAGPPLRVVVADRVEQVELILARVGTLRGTVVGDGAPLAGVRVRAVPQDTPAPASVGHTDNSGAFVLELAAGGYRVTFSAQGRATAEVSAEVIPGEDRVVRQELSSLVELRGHVSLESGQPAAGSALVLFARKHRLRESRAGPDGEFAFGGLAPGAYLLAVSSSTGLQAETVPVLLKAAKTEIAVRLGPAPRFHGRLVNDAATALKGVTVELGVGWAKSDHEVRTDQQGRFIVPAFGRGVHNLRIREFGLKTEVWVDGLGVEELIVVPRHGVELTGWIRNAHAEATANCVVALIDDQGRVTRRGRTNQEGAFRWTGLQQSTARLAVLSELHGAKIVAVDVGREREVAVTLEASGTVRLTVASHARRPTLVLQGTTFQVPALAVPEGFVFRGLPAGTYALRCAEGHEETLTVRPGEEIFAAQPD